MFKRSKKLELIDLGMPHYSAEEYLDCLDKLNKVGQYLGGDKANFKAFQGLDFIPETILDVGSGGGGFTRKLGKYYKEASIVGIDISFEAVTYAKEKNKLPNVIFEQKDLLDMPSKSYDVVLATLVCHHFLDEDLITFLKNALRVAKKKVIINDLHRHFFAWMAFSLIAPPLFNNRLITHDGSLSIKRAFKKSDWKRYLEELNIPATLSWHWPFRWIVTLEVS